MSSPSASLTGSAPAAVTVPNSRALDHPTPATRLANAIGREIIAAGLENREFIENATIGFDAYREGVETYTLEYAERETGVPAAAIRDLAHAYATAPTSKNELVQSSPCTSPEGPTRRPSSRLVSPKPQSKSSPRWPRSMPKRRSSTR